MALHQQLESDLVSDRIEEIGARIGSSAQGKKAAHWVFDPRERQRHERGDAAVEPAEQSPIVVGAPPFYVTRAHDEVASADKLAQHVRNCLGRMTEVSV